ncbi:MAG: TRAP transporter small permease subunit [Spirochaetales bacterium]|jgi:C4-dicarboxylate transporter DctQ subunit|nr:TRAP transporter small permease subunit [Spirochaetales bacterium]
MIHKICNAYAKFLNWVLLALGLSLLIAVALQVAGRYVFFVPLWLWPLEVTNFSLIWMIFIGSIVALREKEHFTVDIFSIFLSKKKDGEASFLNYFLLVLYYIVGFVITAVFTYYGYFYFRDWGMIQASDITGVNLGWLYVSVPFAGVSWFLFLIESFIKDFKIGAGKGGG